jgi:acyl-CoA thioesterase YciA
MFTKAPFTGLSPRSDPRSAPSGSPRGELAARTLAMPADTNPAGDIFGGWIMSLMDAAGGITATHCAQGRVVTVAVTDMAFLQPVKVGDVVCCYTDPVRIGRTSLTLHVEVWVLRQGRGERIKVTSAEFTFVALDESGRPRSISRNAASPTDRHDVLSHDSPEQPKQ